MCYGCALDTAISMSGACPLCRTKCAAIVTYDALELVPIPTSELNALCDASNRRQQKRQANRAAAAVTAAAEEEEEEEEEEEVEAVKVTAKANVGAAGAATTLCWVARVNGPRGELLDSLTPDDIARATGS